MMKAEASDLADKIEYALKTEGRITLFQTDGARALYAVRKLAEHSGQPQTSTQAVADALKTLSGLFAETEHDCWVKEEVVEVIEDFARLRCPDTRPLRQED
jgi:hypothetical protein